MKQVDIDDGEATGTSTTAREKMKRLEQENRHLRQENEILKRASALFA